MAFTARIGMPEPRIPSPAQQAAAAQSSIVFKYVLQAAVNQLWTTLAIASNTRDLQRFFQAWLTIAQNQQGFSGQTRIELVPDIS